MSAYDSVNRKVLSRVRKVARDSADIASRTVGSSILEGQQPRMLSYEQWSGEPEAVAAHGNFKFKFSLQDTRLALGIYLFRS